MKRFYKFLMPLVAIVAMALPWNVQAQELSDYSLQVDTTTFTSIVSTGTALSFTTQDDGYATTTLPFDFPFGETTFASGTSIALSANGFIYLGTSSTSGTTGAYAGTTYHAINAILQADGHLGRNTGAGAYYYHDLSAGTFTIEYHLLGAYSTPYGAYSYQVVLHSNGDIEIIYDSVNHGGASSRVLATYLVNDATDRVFLTGAWASPVVSAAYAARPLSPEPAHGLRYTFTRPIITCPKPPAISALIGVTDMTVYWPYGGTESAWELVFDSVSYFPTDTFYTFSGLTPNTLYEVAVRAICGAGDTSGWRAGAFRTSCTYLDSLPYNYGFEDISTGAANGGGSSTVRPEIPCWNHLNNATTYFGWPYVSSTSHTGNRSLYWYGTTTAGTYGDYEIVVLPPVDTNIYPINTLQLTFWARPSSTSYSPVFKVGVMTDPTDANTFQEVSTVNVANTTTWQVFTVTFGNYTGAGNCVAVRMDRPGSSYYAYTDDFTLEPMPNCPGITNLEATATVGAARLTWDYQEGFEPPANYDVIYDSIGGASPVTLSFSETQALLTGLEAGTTYKVYVRANCGSDGMGAFDSVEFTTGGFTCIEFDPSSTFSDTINVGTSNSTYFPSYSFYNYSLTQQIYTAAEIGHACGITSVSFKMQAVSQQRTYEIYMGHTSSATATDFLNPADLTLVYDGGPVTLTANAWSTFNLTTTFNYNGSDNLVIFFRDMTGSYVSGNAVYGTTTGASGCSRYVYRDDSAYPVGSTTGGTSSNFRPMLILAGASCLQTGSCASPILYVTSVDTGSVELAWIPGASETSWNVDYRADGDATWTSAATSVSTTSYTVTGLESATDYEFRVSHTCDTTMYSSTVTQRTPCPDITIPYTYSFEDLPTGSSSIRPDILCWHHLNNGSSYFGYPYIYASAAHTGSKGLYWYLTTTTGTYGDYEIVVLPPVDTTTTPINNMQLTFWAKPTSTSYAPVFLVGVMTNPEDVSTFQTVQTINIPSGNTDWKMYEVYLDSYTGNGKYVAIRANRPTSSWYAYLDDVTLDVIPTCPHVTDIHTTLNTGDSIMLTWNTVGEEQEWIVTLGDTTIVTTEDSVLITDLSPSMHYFGTITSVCSVDDSSYAYPFHIMTACGKLTRLPYVQDFENESPTSSSSSAFIPCWGHLNNATSYPGYPYLSATTTYNHTENGGKGLYWGASTTTGSYGDYYIIALPEVDTNIYPVRNLKLSFWTKSSSTSYQPVFYVGVMSNPNVDSTFQYVDTINVGNTTEWTRFTTVFNNYSDTGTYIAIRGNRPSSTWYAYMDDIVLDEMPACPSVEDVTIVAGTTSAIVSWNILGDANVGSLVEYKASDATTWSNMTVTGQHYAVLTGLSDATTYDVRITGTCAESNATPVTSYFTTRSFACEQYDTTTMVAYSDTIGNGTVTNSYFPSYSLYNYGLTQQIYTPSELGHAGTINSVAFKMANVSQQRTFEIYMGHTTEATAQQFLNPADLTLVYNGGAVTLAANQWINFNLTTPFNYNGSDNLVVFFRDMTGSYVSGNTSYGTEGTSGVSRYIYQDGGAYTVGSTSGGTASTFRCNLVFGGLSAQCIQQSTCAAPVAIVTDVTTTTATIVWAPGNTETAWNLYYRLDGDDNFTLAASNVTATNYTFTNLASGRPYEFKVENVCSGNSLFTVVEAITECSTITLPFTETFNSWGAGSGIMPNCWSRAGSYSSYTYISASYNMTGNTGGSIYMYQGSSTPYTAYASTLILPTLDTTLYQVNQTQLVFSTMYASTSYGRPKFEVGVVTNPQDFNTFVPLDTVQHSGGINRWETFEVPLTGDTTYGAYVALRTVYDSTYTYAYLDNVTLELIPTCPRPDTLYAINATINSVDLGWHDRAGASQWIIEYGPVGFQLGTGTTVVANSNPFTLTGLPAAYQGEFYVKAVCGAGDTGDYSRICCGFNTTQIPATIPYHYDFENATEWGYWQTSSNSATNNWFRGTAVADSGSYSMYMSTDSGATYIPYINNAVVNAAAYRDIDFGTIDSSFTISFRARVGGTIANRYDGLMVFLVDPSLSTIPSNSGITSPWGNVNDLYRIATVYLDTTWQTYEASFDTIHGVHRVAFFWFNQNTGSSNASLEEAAAVDNIHITYSSCPRPLNLTSVATTGSTATLTWTGASNATYEVIYRQTGSTNHTIIANTNSITLTGLASAAEHRAFVRKLCGVGDTSLWSDGVIFNTTLCDGAVEMTTGASTGTSYYTPVDNFYKYTLTETIIDSAELVGLGNITTIAYEYAYATASTDKTNVDIWIQPTTKSTFSSSSDMEPLDTNIAVLVYSGNLNCSQGWNYFAFTTPYVWDGHSNLMIIVDDNSNDYNGSAYVFNNTACTGYKTLVWYSDTYNPDPTSSTYSGSKTYFQYRATMRLISCGGLNCEAPATVTIDTVGETSASINWTSAGDSYEVAVVQGTTWIEPAAGTAVADTFYTFTGLTGETDYILAVRTVCGSGHSDWTTVSITTMRHPCAVPTNVTVTDPTYDGATVSWTIGEAETDWQVRVFCASPLYDDTILVSGTPSTTIHGLANDAVFSVAVRAVCDPTWMSPWSDTVTLTPTSCPQVTGVTSSNVTATTATITWTSTGAASYEIEYGNRGFTQGNGTTLTSTTNSVNLTGLEEQTSYDVYVRSVCVEGVTSAWSDKLTVTTPQSDGIDDVAGSNVTLFPNPASEMVTIRGIEGECTVTVVDLNGREVYKTNANNTLTIDVTGYAKGAYFVRITGERTTAIRKLVVK